MFDMPPAQLSALAWLTGCWRTTTDDNGIEECWTTPAADSIAGVYRQLRAGQVSLYELLVIKPVADSLTLYIKHFNRDLVGKEAIDQSTELALEWLNDDEVAFRERNPDKFFRLRYYHPNNNSLDVIVEFTPDGSQSTTISYQRA